MKFGKAPYNFVNLPTKPKRIQKEHVGKHNILRKENYTGYLEYIVTTKSPLFIGAIEEEKKKNDFNVIKPFEINGQRAIPGSSIRGMIYNLLEILSDSPFKNFEDRQLYFRDIASGGKLSEKYFQQINDIKKGLLFLENGSFFITPVDNSNFESEPKNISKSKNKQNTFEVSENTIKWRTGLINKPLSKSGKGFYCGEYEFKLSNTKDPIPVPDEVLHDFFYDEMENKNEAHRIAYSLKGTKKLYLDWAKYFSKNPHSNDAKGIPVFYTLDGNEKVKTFGHTKYHRIPHAHKISHFIPKSHRSIDNDNIGMSEALMGNKEDFASRLRFTDALLTKNDPDIYEDKGILKILMTPKPTSFSFYLQQDSTDPKELTNYSSDHGEIRGYKLYWNKNIVDWKENEEDADSKFQKKIEPIKEGVEFSGKIYYNNLTKKELGLLLFALELEDGMYHRLGMGKPYGMGMVKVSISEYKRYKSDKRYQRPGSDFFNGAATGKIGFYIDHYLKSEWRLMDKNEYFRRYKFDFKLMSSEPSSIIAADEEHSYISYKAIKDFKYPLVTLPGNIDIIGRGDFTCNDATFISTQNEKRYMAKIESITNPMAIHFNIDGNIDGKNGKVIRKSGQIIAVNVKGENHVKPGEEKILYTIDQLIQDENG